MKYEDDFIETKKYDDALLNDGELPSSFGLESESEDELMSVPDVIKTDSHKLLLWSVKKAIGTDPEDIKYYSRTYPDMMQEIKNLTFAQIKGIKENQKSKIKKISYVSVIDGKRNSFQYSLDTYRVNPPSAGENLSYAEVVARLKHHHDALIAEWKKPKPTFIISEERMEEIGWYPAPTQTMTEQFEEYTTIFTAPERARRETFDSELHWDLEWVLDKRSRRKQNCSSRSWRERNIWGFKRLDKRDKRFTLARLKTVY